MISLIGQERLSKIFDGMSFDKFPRTNMFIGESGCGKKTLVRQIARDLKIPATEIHKDITHEEIREYLLSPVESIYLIDLEEFPKKAQNILLKFIEEPSPTSLIFITAVSEFYVLPTILNRCVAQYFDKYSAEDFKKIYKITNDIPEYVSKICTTPGKLKNFDLNNAKKIYDVCFSFIDRVKIMPVEKLFNLKAMINFKEDYDKIDFKDFLSTLVFIATENIKNNSNEELVKISEIVLKKVKKAQADLREAPTISTETLYTNTMLSIWKEVRI